MGCGLSSFWRGHKNRVQRRSVLQGWYQNIVGIVLYVFDIWVGNDYFVHLRSVRAAKKYPRTICDIVLSEHRIRMVNCKPQSKNLPKSGRRTHLFPRKQIFQQSYQTTFHEVIQAASINCILLDLSLILSSASKIGSLFSVLPQFQHLFITFLIKYCT